MRTGCARIGEAPAWHGPRSGILQDRRVSLWGRRGQGRLAGMARQSQDLVEELGAGLLPEPEFRTILAAHFREVAQPEPRVISYGLHDDTALLAHYKNGRLRRLEAGPALKPDDIDAVAARVRSEAAETREHVHRSIVFSPRRPAGFWRFTDRFQLLPAPPSAPDTPGLAPHPLVLEFKVRWSADTTLNTMRWTDTETRPGSSCFSMPCCASG